MSNSGLFHECTCLCMYICAYYLTSVVQLCWCHPHPAPWPGSHTQRWSQCWLHHCVSPAVTGPRRASAARVGHDRRDITDWEGEQQCLWCVVAKCSGSTVGVHVCVCMYIRVCRGVGVVYCMYHVLYCAFTVCMCICVYDSRFVQYCACKYVHILYVCMFCVVCACMFACVCTDMHKKSSLVKPVYCVLYMSTCTKWCMTTAFSVVCVHRSCQLEASRRRH